MSNEKQHSPADDEIDERGPGGDVSAATIPEDVPLTPEQAAGDEGGVNREAYKDAMRSRQESFGRSTEDEEALPESRG